MHDIGVTLKAVLVGHHRLCGDKSTRCCLRKRGLKVLTTVLWNPRTRVRDCEMKSDRGERSSNRNRAPTCTDVPSNAPTRKSMDNKEPNNCRRSNDVHPIDEFARSWLTNTNRGASNLHTRQRNSCRE